MRQFYEAWSNLLIWQPAAAEMADQEKWQPHGSRNLQNGSRYAGRTPQGASGRTAIERVAFW